MAQSALLLQPSISTDNERKIEASLNEDNSVKLKLSTWTEALGWSCQKTIDIEPEMLDDLHHAITAMRCRVNRKKTEQGEAVSESRVVEFPSFA